MIIYHVIDTRGINDLSISRDLFLQFVEINLYKEMNVLFIIPLSKICFPNGPPYPGFAPVLR